MRSHIVHITVFLAFLAIHAKAQISPGDLAQDHAELEGVLNCTQCHVLGGTVSNDKCLDCHQDLAVRITQNKGYHSSSQVSGKNCATCHSDHHGLSFEMIRFEEENFRHHLTGYKLTGAHDKIDCRDCHQPDFITNRNLKKNKNTYLGLEEECISCHSDYHQETLSINCADCHSTASFAPADHFDHNQTEFALRGKHQEVACVDCHKTEIRNGKEFQRFAGIEFESCITCHQDPHENKFGTNCAECHSEESFIQSRSLASFNHDLTGFQLTGKHRNVDCRSCHSQSFVQPIAHNTCTSCHEDYHRGEFTKNGLSPDCIECHTVDGFETSLYSIEDHNKSRFPLEEAHLATPCFSCHLQEDRWSFKNLGERCVDCHQDVHEGYIDEKYYPGQSCESCHLTTTWKESQFNHDLTEFALSGVHADQECMACHGDENLEEAHKYQNFQSLSSECASCHEDSHYRQFEQSGITDCARCHGFDGWLIDNFNHGRTRFLLEGKHAQLDCESCHQETEKEEQVFVQYKFRSFECIDCHQ